jgi:hypothetical protein
VDAQKGLYNAWQFLHPLRRVLHRSTLFMALTEFSLEEAFKSLSEDGYFDFNDREVGELVSEMEHNGFRFLSLYGLDYCERNVLKNTVKVTR